MGSHWTPERLAKTTLALCFAATVAGCTDTQVAREGTIASVVETLTPYDLVDENGTPPSRSLRFWIGENASFSSCAPCLCVNGLFTAAYPRLGISQTARSPKPECDSNSPEFAQDERMLGRFLAMTEAGTQDPLVILSDASGATMTFRPGPRELASR